MKLIRILVVVGTMMICAGTVDAEVVIKQVPLQWEDVAHLEGGEVFNNLCSACHGVSGKGNGPAVAALEKPVPDLTALAVNNGGVYPSKHVKHVIYGRFRDEGHGAVGMPIWGQHFEYVNSRIPQKAYAWERVNSLDKHIESLQDG